MPPRRWSRHTFARALRDDDGRLFLTDVEPYRFRSLPDNRLHIAQQGDTLFTLAARYFAPLPRPAGLWWVIADFQPEPIHDPTIALELGQEIVVPSVRTLVEEVFAETRRKEAGG